MTDFEPIRFEPGYRRVATAIAARILNRTLREGDPLPPESTLAEQFAVNRSTVREALRELESADLVTRRRGTKRMIVTRPAADQIAGRVGSQSPFQWELLLHYIPPLNTSGVQYK